MTDISKTEQSSPVGMVTDTEIIKACRDVGGIVHSDGNMFFANPRKFREATALLAHLYSSVSEDKQDAERYRYVKKIAFESELPGQTKEEFEKFIDDGIDKHAKGER